MKWMSEAIQGNALVGALLPRKMDHRERKNETSVGQEEAGTSEKDARRTQTRLGGHGDAPAGTTAREKMLHEKVAASAGK